MRSTNRATCRTIEYMDQFVNKYSEALLLLNKAPSPMLDIEDQDLEGEAVLQKEQAAEEDRRARARSRSEKATAEETWQNPPTTRWTLSELFRFFLLLEPLL